LMKSRTSFIIAHRLSTIRNADQVLVLHNRRIIESGTHDQLMSKSDGFYAKLYGMQDQKPEIYESDFVDNHEKLQ
jgi:ABC-type multidrug transport system fused ATPase/permease subunit